MARILTPSKMAAASGRLRDCTACFRETKYGCIICLAPLCNLCATPEKDERTDGWIVAKRVGYCEECTEALGLPGKPNVSKGRSASPSVVSSCDKERYVVTVIYLILFDPRQVLLNSKQQKNWGSACCTVCVQIHNFLPFSIPLCTNSIFTPFKYVVFLFYLSTLTYTIFA